MVSPKIHIIGAGSVGALVGTALASTTPPAYVTYILRSQDRLRSYLKNDSTIHLETDSAGPRTSIARKIPAVIPPGTLLRNGDPEPIDNLIVSTKSQDTYEALKSVQPALHHTSNILLLQNGLGVYESAIKTLWPDPKHRPIISIGITNHAVFPLPSPWSFNHVGKGSLKVAQVPRFDEKLKLDHGHRTDAEEHVRAEEHPHDPIPGPTPSHRHSTDPTGSEESVKADYADFDLSHHKKGVQPDYHAAGAPTDSEACTKADYATDFAPERVIHNPIIDALNTATGMLNVEVIPYPELLLAQYEKLVVNCVINPLTAILDVHNGQLLDADKYESIVNGVVNETIGILKAHAEAIYSPDVMFVISSSLSAKRIKQLVLDTTKLTAMNKSSMLVDVTNLRDTELPHLNDFVAKLAAEQGRNAIYNRLLADLVRARLSLLRQRDDRFSAVEA